MNAKAKKAPAIALTACKSSQVAAHGYDAATRTLAVKFNNGGTYHYHDVPEKTYQELKKAQSIGGFLHSNVKNLFKHKKAEGVK